MCLCVLRLLPELILDIYAATVHQVAASEKRTTSRISSSKPHHIQSSILIFFRCSA